jgi:hypothetical protein
LAPFLFKPRDGYRTRTAPDILGPMIEYYLPLAPTGPVVMEILDAKGAIVNRYSSDPAAGGAGAVGGGGRGGRGGGGGAGRGGRGGGGGGGAAAATRVTKLQGMNRWTWDVRHSSGLPATPGAHQVRMTVNGEVLTQPFNLLVDPLLAEEGLTAADLQEQFDHNTRMRALVAAVGVAVGRVREAQSALRNATGADLAKAKQVEAIAAKLITEPVRYGKPGLQAQITYLNGMAAGVDQKVGRDNLARYEVLKKELDAIVAELDKVLGR